MTPVSLSIPMSTDYSKFLENCFEIVLLKLLIHWFHVAFLQNCFSFTKKNSFLRNRNSPYLLCWLKISSVTTDALERAQHFALKSTKIDYLKMIFFRNLNSRE